MRLNGVVLRSARWSVRRPWLTLASWLVFVALCAAVGSLVGTNHLDKRDTGAGQSAEADKVVDARDFGVPPTEEVAVQPRTGTNADPVEAGTIVSELKERYARIPGVAKVDEPSMSKDQASRLLEVSLDTGVMVGRERNARARQLVKPVLAATREVQQRHPGFHVDQAGDTSVDVALDEQIGLDFQRAEYVSLPVTLIILVLAFGALVAAGVPLLLALTAVAGALGMAAVISQVMPQAGVVSSLVLLVGMAVGVDYSLFYIRREREERARGVAARDAIEIAAATSGRAVAVSGLAVIIAMGGMFFAGNKIFHSLAVGTILVVAVSVVGSVTVLPAVLGILGDKIDRPRIRILRRRRHDTSGSRLWPAVMRVVLARPSVSFTVAAELLLALAIPALGLTLALPDTGDLPRSIPIVQANDRIQSAFPGAGWQTPAHQVVVRSTNDKPLPGAEMTAALEELRRRALASGQFTQDAAQPWYWFAKDGTAVLAKLDIPHSPNSPEAARSLALLRGELVPATVGRVPGTWAVGSGDTATNRDLVDQMVQRLPWVCVFVLGLTFIVMLVSFRSAVVAATSIMLNLLSVAASYGLLVLVFQHHWAEGLLDFRSNGAVVTWLPMFLFVVLFGLSMDYHVFVVSRIREAVQRGMDIREAVRHGITASAPTVTSAAVVMVAVFAIFAVLKQLEFKQLGIGLGAAVLLDATVVRAVLLPATMALLGRLNWYLPTWPRWLRPSTAGVAPKDG